MPFRTQPSDDLVCTPSSSVSIQGLQQLCDVETSFSRFCRSHTDQHQHWSNALTATQIVEFGKLTFRAPQVLFCKMEHPWYWYAPDVGIALVFCFGIVSIFVCCRWLVIRGAPPVKKVGDLETA
ncbi:hypothetical protein L596_026207 [Steinernema carpocapsae]|uniref:Uncharacterized protein n=1 Tax=Steinernema carpocapsae TaxID=34508 RepID=A0A4U5M0N6_STECR|nr:hypothetical protein L596_026207 [Steinernema carpocapsae]